ncbi:MAG: hypothetical protein AOA66_1450 [Candidatus Bathyarchaeota archaeon BA2]|nr:MAG: hypothetical protein AOA66_1450 [Candidatus Bathyarchaeota archaeon BA2]
MRIRTCEICGKRAARYVCQECGHEVCQFCFEPNTWVCLDCYNHLRREAQVEAFPWPAPFKLFLLGFILMFIGMILMVIAAVFFGVPAGAGFVVFIPPLPPIGFGAGQYAFFAILLAVALAIVLILFIMLRRRT